MASLPMPSAAEQLLMQQMRQEASMKELPSYVTGGPSLQAPENLAAAEIAAQMPEVYFTGIAKDGIQHSGDLAMIASSQFWTQLRRLYADFRAKQSSMTGSHVGEHLESVLQSYPHDVACQTRKIVEMATRETLQNYEAALRSKPFNDLQHAILGALRTKFQMQDLKQRMDPGLLSIVTNARPVTQHDANAANVTVSQLLTAHRRASEQGYMFVLPQLSKEVKQSLSNWATWGGDTYKLGQNSVTAHTAWQTANMAQELMLLTAHQGYNLPQLASSGQMEVPYGR